MTLCYYKETFTLGFISALFVFAMMTIFEDFVKCVIMKIRKRLL